MMLSWGFRSYLVYGVACIWPRGNFQREPAVGSHNLITSQYMTCAERIMWLPSIAVEREPGLLLLEVKLQ